MDSPDPLYLCDRNHTALPLRDVFPDTAAFLVCGGPSLANYPLDRLRDRGVLAMGVNNAAAAAPCNMFVHADPPFKFHDALWRDPKVWCFTPLQKLKRRSSLHVKLPDGRFMQARKSILDCPSVFGFQRDSRIDPPRFFDTRGAQWGNNDAGVAQNGRPKGMFTMLLGFRILHYLGVRRVYLLGADFSMATDRQYAFGEHNGAGHASSNNDKFPVLNAILTELRPVFESRGFKVFNCAAQSACTAFGHVPFDRALEKCRNEVPLEPYDLQGWYEKRVDVREGDE